MTIVCKLRPLTPHPQPSTLLPLLHLLCTTGGDFNALRQSVADAVLEINQNSMPNRNSLHSNVVSDSSPSFTHPSLVPPFFPSSFVFLFPSAPSTPPSAKTLRQLYDQIGETSDNENTRRRM